MSRTEEKTVLDFHGSSRTPRMRLAAGAAACAALFFAGCGSSSGDGTSSNKTANAANVTNTTGKIYVLNPNTTTPSWPTYYAPAILAAVKKEFPKADVVTLVGDDNQEKQLGQVQAAVSAGAKGVIITPVDPAQAASSLSQLAAAKIPTVAYLHDPTGGPVFAYVGVDFTAVGKYFATYIKQHVAELGHGGPIKLGEVLGDPTFQVYKDYLKGATPILQPLIDSGKVTVVCKADTKAWDPSAAQTEAEQCLTKNGNKVDAILSMNDSTDDGIWAALKAQGLNGKVPIIGGHDASLTGVQRVLTGDQVATFNFDAKTAGTAAAVLLKAAIEGKSPQSTGVINAKFDNGFVKGDVPMAKAPELAVTPATVAKLVVRNGIFSKEQICKGIAANTSFCKS